ncbi:hypothetical protein M409DRAFT_30555 [Zasmidium cellare ATCC 36951]|uniref:Xylanolytic transcriptional activator regulatory domain-containing protein n=1 Tax=Zasmidium cellare ATCC 36951 TaxID=1080233 RepID=A0A6A6BYK5_ZASCE|nr:uncharacterized protein M409DRAFT_30555 [Zasmidium cellare ATCC 36951]KAF2159020.1 hypothetical protein M409DRAFT_30555 [Zasmidium cellare ATCC 36951]
MLELHAESVARDESRLLARVERLERLILTKDNNAGQADLERGSSTGLSPKYEVNNSTDGEGLLTALFNADLNGPSKFVKGQPIAVHSLSEILTMLNSGHDANHGWGESTLLVPPYQVSLQLLRLFELYIDPICCITHPQTTRAELDTFYIGIAKYEETETQHTAMMLSTMSLSIFFCRPMDLLKWGISETDNIKIASYMHDAASNLLEQTIRSSRINLCAAQAAILMSYFIYHRDGPSSRYRHLLSTATFIASELCLPSMDGSDSYSNVSKHQDDAVTKELKRRVFWHLASIEGLNYASFPSNTATIMDFEHTPMRWPSDFSDSGRISNHKDGNDVLQRPTAVTYLLARMKLAAISRRAAIPTRGHSHNVNQDSYDQILALDREFERFLNDLPYFFRLDQESCQQSEALEPVFSLLPIMRYSIPTAAHSRRLKLHQTFLLRQAADERYQDSR